MSLSTVSMWLEKLNAYSWPTSTYVNIGIAFDRDGIGMRAWKNYFIFHTDAGNVCVYIEHKCTHNNLLMIWDFVYVFVLKCARYLWIIKGKWLDSQRSTRNNKCVKHNNFWRCIKFQICGVNFFETANATAPDFRRFTFKLKCLSLLAIYARIFCLCSYS